MNINPKCKDYRPVLEKVNDDIVRSTYSEPPLKVRHECHHFDGFSVTKACQCDVRNDYCPYNPNRSQQA